MVCSVCIATFKRPVLLKKLLNSLVDQILPEDVEIEILIVDNDAEKSAKSIYEQFLDTSQFQIHYYTQPIKNISLTRNMAVEKATGEYILFIDDDEVASQEWIANLLFTLKEFNADAVFGRVISYFIGAPPLWVTKCFLYNRPAPPTGTEALSTRTGNCVVKSSLLKEIRGPFNPEYGVTGGEDTQLFEKLRHKGAKFVNCYEAWTSEFVPPERTQIRWLLKRAFITGNNHTRRRIEFAQSGKIKIRFIQAIIGICYSIISLFLILIPVPKKIWRVHWVLKVAANIGKLYAVFGYFPVQHH